MEFDPSKVSTGGTGSSLPPHQIKSTPSADQESRPVVVHIAKQHIGGEASTESKVPPPSENSPTMFGRGSTILTPGSTISTSEYTPAMQELAQAAAAIQKAAATQDQKAAATQEKMDSLADEIKPRTTELLNGHIDTLINTLDHKIYSQIALRDFAGGARPIEVTTNDITQVVLPKGPSLQSKSYDVAVLTKEAIGSTVYGQMEERIEQDGRFKDPHTVNNVILTALSQSAIALPSNSIIINYFEENDIVPLAAQEETVVAVQLSDTHVKLTQTLVLKPPELGSVGGGIEGINYPTRTITLIIEIPISELNKDSSIYGKPECNIQFTMGIGINDSGPSMREQTASPVSVAPPDEARVRKRDQALEAVTGAIGSVKKVFGGIFRRVPKDSKDAEPITIHRASGIGTPTLVSTTADLGEVLSSRESRSSQSFSPTPSSSSQLPSPSSQASSSPPQSPSSQASSSPPLSPVSEVEPESISDAEPESPNWHFGGTLPELPSKRPSLPKPLLGQKKPPPPPPS